MKSNQEKIQGITSFILGTVMTLIVILLLLGFLMRSAQSSVISIPSQFFYAVMTLHGLGLAGTLFIGGLIAIWYLLSKYIEMSTGLLKFNFILIVLGVVLLLLATLVGGFGPGWYVLYPLPFLEGAWPRWTVLSAIVSLMLLGVSWLLWQLDILRAIIARYGVKGFLGWNYFSSNREGEQELPPVVLISSVIVIAGSLTTVVGAAMLFLYLLKWIDPSFQFDPLLMKNMVFLFGHTIVNVTMYGGLAIVYELLPEYTGKPWKTNKIVVASWNAALVFVILAYFHHLYMDFNQPLALHITGQIASYLSTVPATVVTIFGAISQFYKSDKKWSYTPLAIGLSLMGWIIGGFIAVVDSTIAVNNFFHNTLWVVSHFHTYFLMGFVLMLFAFIHHYASPSDEKFSRISLWMMLVGGYGIIFMFAHAGVKSVPRRYASYDAIPLETVAECGRHSALIAAGFSLVLILGVIAFYRNIFPALITRK